MKRTFYTMLWTIGLPVALQNLISTSVNLMDTLMVGRLGESALSAVSIANQIFFFYSISIFGITSAAVILCSQYWGSKKVQAIQKVLTLSLRLAAVAGAVFAMLLLLIPKQLMCLFTPDAAVIEMGIGYLRIVAVAYLFYGLTTTCLMVLRSVEDVKIAMCIYSLSVVVNIFFNYMFIFGKFGAPALGVAGAAMGTLIARSLEFVIMLVYMLRVENKIRYRLFMLGQVESVLLKDMIHYGTPVMINELLWGAAHSLHLVILGHMSVDAVAANSICSVIYQMTLSFVIGVSSASAVIIGKTVGQGDLSQTSQYAHKLLRVYFVVGLALAGLILLLREPMVQFYKIAPETAAMAQQFMLVYAVVMFCTGFCHPLITGILRGGGDIMYAAVTDVGCLWMFLPIGAAAAFLLQLEPPLVYFVLRLEIVLKTVLCLFRLRNDNWIHVVTRDHV